MSSSAYQFIRLLCREEASVIVHQQLLSGETGLWFNPTTPIKNIPDPYENPESRLSEGRVAIDELQDFVRKRKPQ